MHLDGADGQRVSPPTTMTMKYYELRVIRLERLRWMHLFHRKVPNFYVEVKLGDITHPTRIVRASKTPVWNEAFVLPISDETQTLRISIRHSSRWRDPIVGYLEIKFLDILARCANGEAFFEVQSSSRRSSATVGIIVLEVKSMDSVAAVGDAIGAARDDVERRGIAESEVALAKMQSVSGGATQVSSQGDLYCAVGDLLSKLECFKDAMDALSQLHPYLTIAWTAASALYTVVKKVYEKDSRIMALVRTMDDAFSFVRNVQALQDKVSYLHETVEALLKQTIECCYFVRHYVSHGFLGRALDTKGSGTIDNYEQALATLRNSIHSGISLHTSFVSSRSSQKIEEIWIKERLSPVPFEAGDRPHCLPGTRQEITNDIIKWASSETDQNIFWLYGVAGCGKSTVSTTIAEHFRGVSRLGAFLFFERGKSDPSTVIRTIAYKLALFDPSIGSAIISAIEKDKDIATAPLMHQFDTLLLPLRAVAESFPGPILVVLDALDECGTLESRRGLLELFRTCFAKLPNIFRFLVTSRREKDIDKFLSLHLKNVVVWELEHASAQSQKDVHSYLHVEMRNAIGEQVHVPSEWMWDDKMSSLSAAANGLFIWASTAVKTVRYSNDPFNLLDQLVENSQSLSGFGLDDMYASVLDRSGIMWKDERSRERFARVLSLVLLSKAPLSIKAIDGILGWKEHETSNFVLAGLRSFITYTPGGTVALFHTSFSDYLMSPERSSDPWSIDIPASRTFISKRCFVVMNNFLRFNICDLESSFVRNDDIPGLANRIRERIPSHLEYACVYWVQHLLEVPVSHAMLDKVSDFAHLRLLFWFEVLSLVKAFYRIASRGLSDAAEWAEPCSAEISAFLRDASDLASTFAPAISQCTPHIYVSMIPLAKDDLQVTRHYFERGAAFVGVERDGVRKPAMHLKVLDGHSDCVLSVAFSLNRKHIASASADGTIRIWDVTSGEEICSPLTGHSGSVTSVCFSTDGRRIVSGSSDGTIIVWDAETGELILGPLSGHEESVLSVIFSPDGTQIASGSADGTIIIWDAEKGEPISDPLTGHSGVVNSVAFSLDGTQLVSGSHDMTVIIWDVENGRPLYKPLHGHSDPVWSVAFSPDGKHVISGSGDTTIKIWNAESGSVISTLSGHSLDVMSVAYSPCGTRIVSGSDDNTITIWDAKIGQVASGPLKGHSGTVWSVAWSRDGKYITSGSDDKTVRIWDATARVDNPEQFSGHTAAVTSVALSSDASRIASASVDGSIIVWDAEKGDIVLGPLLGHSVCVGCVAYSLDGSRLISGSDDRTIRVWNANNGAMILGPLEGHTDEIWCIALSPDGSTVASGSKDRTIRIWDLKSGALIAGPLHGHSDGICSVAFSPDGKLLVSGSYDKTIRGWDTTMWECISVPLMGHSKIVCSVCFSRDGSRIASGSYDGTIIIWDVQSQRMIGNPLIGHTNAVLSVIFSLGKYVISGSADTTIRIWNADSGSNIKILEGHTSPTTSFALFPDGSRLVSGSFDNTIRMWDVSHLYQPPGESSGSITVAAPRRNEDLSEWVLDGGWILPGHGRRELILWIPPGLRATLWRPQNTAILSCEFFTSLDFSSAALGDRWTECFVHT